jgi:hypothetical protein
MTPDQSAFMRKVEIAPNGCWIWKLSLSSTGYPVAHVPGVPGVPRVTSGARVSYELFIGPIPAGLQLHHEECRNPICVNPRHVRPVTHHENTLIGFADRGIAPACHVCIGCYHKRVGYAGGQCRACALVVSQAAIRARIIAAFQRYAAQYGQPPSATCWNVAFARSKGRLDLVERYESGDWPAMAGVVRIFGSWADALAAAGFPPNPTGGAAHTRGRCAKKVAA